MLAEGSDAPPATPFQIFSLELREMKANWPSRLSPLEISRKIAQAWLELPAQAKRVYYDRACTSNSGSAETVDGIGTGGQPSKVARADYRDRANRFAESGDSGFRQTQRVRQSLVHLHGHRHTVTPPSAGRDKPPPHLPTRPKIPTRTRR
jgi:hypothetical protein